MVKPGQKVIISLPLSRTMLVRHPAWASKLERSPINSVIRGPVLICMHGHHSVCRHASSPVVLPSAVHSFKKVVALVLDTSCCPLSGAQFTIYLLVSSHDNLKEDDRGKLSDGHCSQIILSRFAGRPQSLQNVSSHAMYSFALSSHPGRRWKRSSSWYPW